MPDGVEALRRLGIEIPREEAQPFRGIRFISRDQTAEAEFPRGTAYGLRRTTLHRILLEHAAARGIHLAWQTAVTGLDPEGARVAGHLVRARWVVGADGAASRVRRWANLDRQQCTQRRYAFRRHYRAADWTDFMELHWGPDSQLYVTRVSPEEVCVALISSDPNLRVDEALASFPGIFARLARAPYASTERGAVTVNRRLRRVYRDRTVLIGDASGGVDAITGEGLCLAFQQAVLLADCLAADDLARYQVGHRRLMRRPTLMARLMLLLARHPHLRRRTMQVFESNPTCFAGMLATHVGACSPRDSLSIGMGLGWRLLTA